MNEIIGKLIYKDPRENILYYPGQEQQFLKDYAETLFFIGQRYVEAKAGNEQMQIEIDKITNGPYGEGGY